MLRLVYMRLARLMAQATRVQMDPAPVDLEQQFSLLLGRRVLHNIRKTEARPTWTSVIDVLMAITGQDANHAAKDFRRIKEQYPEVNPAWVSFKFTGKGQKNTPVADARGIVESGRAKKNSNTQIQKGWKSVCFTRHCQ